MSRTRLLLTAAAAVAALALASSVLRCKNGNDHGFTLTPTAFKLF